MIAVIRDDSLKGGTELQGKISPLKRIRRLDTRHYCNCIQDKLTVNNQVEYPVHQERVQSLAGRVRIIGVMAVCALVRCLTLVP